MKKFFECYIPITMCNLKCEYCYVMQEKRRTEKKANFKYDVGTIQKALTVERLGGNCYFSICGAGETLLQPECTDIVKKLLENGHYVNITTNGTISPQIRELSDLPQDLRERIHIAFSLHYLELKKHNLLNVFFENVRIVKNAGISFVVQLNLYDGYFPCLDDIKRICQKELGADPQVAVTRYEGNNKVDKKVSVYSKTDLKNYYAAGESFGSPLFEFTFSNFGVKRKEFCYAGCWSGVLDLSTGILKKCDCSYFEQNIFKNLNSKIIFEPIGNHCRSPYCVNSSHFIALGTIPSIDCESYAELRNREKARWYNSEMKSELNKKLSVENVSYTKKQIIFYNLLYWIREFQGAVFILGKRLIGKR